METGIDKEALNKIPMGILVLDGRDLDHIVFASHMAAHIWACEDEEELMAFCGGHFTECHISAGYVAGKQGNETGDETGTE